MNVSKKVSELKQLLTETNQLLQSNNQRLENLEAGQAQITLRMTAVESGQTEIKEEFKGWTNWLRVVSGTILITVAFAFFGILIPLAISFWRQTI